MSDCRKQGAANKLPNMSRQIQSILRSNFLKALRFVEVSLKSEDIFNLLRSFLSILLDLTSATSDKIKLDPTTS